MQRRGLTLLELVVVLTILVALAGILVPMVAGLLSTTSTSAGATNASELENWVQTYLSKSHRLDLLDNLVNNSNDSLMSFVLTNSGTSPPDIVPYALQANDVTSLNSLGVANVYPLIENPGTTSTPPWNPTFFPYAASTSAANLAGLPTSAPLTTGTYVAQLNSTIAAQKLSVSSSGTYVVFGLGKYSTISSGAEGQPKYLTETPLSFNPSFGCDPNSVYCRFGLVFQVDTTNGTTANFIGAVQFTATGVVTRDDNLIGNANKQ